MAIGKVVKYWEARPPSGTPIDRNNPLTRGLVFADSLVQMRDGIQPTRVGTRPQVKNGIQARGFGTTLGVGTTDSIEVPFNKHSTKRTYLIRMLKNGQGGGNIGRVFEKRVSGAESELLFSSSATELQFNRSYSTQGSQGRIVVTNGVFFNLAITIDTTVTDVTARPVFYINGVLTAQSFGATPTGTITNNTDNYVIGNRKNDNARNWDGILSDFVIIDRILSQAEIKAYSDNLNQIYESRDVYYVNAGGGAIDYPLDAASGSYVLTGSDAGLLTDYVLNAETGSYTLTGSDATFDIGMHAASGNYDITGFEASLVADYSINAEAGAYSITGAVTNFDITMQAESGVYVLTGFDVALLGEYNINAQPGSYTISGYATDLFYDDGTPSLEGLFNYPLYKLRRR